MTAFELYALSIAGLAIAVLVGWRINSRERRRNGYKRGSKGDWRASGLRRRLRCGDPYRQKRAAV